MLIVNTQAHASLNALGNQLWSQHEFYIAGSAEANDNFGEVLAVGDFDGDGASDLAIGTPNEALGTVAYAGAVNVIYGGNWSNGLSVYGNELITQNILNDSASQYELFGAALAAGDFNGDGYDDLAIGVPGESIDDNDFAGEVYVVYGSPEGFMKGGVANYEIFSQNLPELSGMAEAGDEFGESLAAGDFNSDGYADLAIGVPQEHIGDIEDAGVVHVVFGHSSGLILDGNQLWQQNSPGVSGSPEADDGFGTSLTTGFFNGDEFEDLAIGVPFEDYQGVANVGVVHVLFGAEAGINGADSKFLTQSTAGDFTYDNDRFGETLAAGNLNDDDIDELIVGLPGNDWLNADLDMIEDIGAVHVYLSDPSGPFLSVKIDRPHHQVWETDQVNSFELFGEALTVADFDRDGFEDLAVGVPGDLNSFTGSIHVFYGGDDFFNMNQSYRRQQIWTQDSLHILDQAEPTDYFGEALSSGDFNNDGFSDLAVGTPDEDIEDRRKAGVVNIIYGSDIIFRSTLGNTSSAR